MSSNPPVGELLCVGIRGAVPGELPLEEDLDACRRAGIGGVILFDVDVPTLRRLEEEEGRGEVSVLQAPRNVLSPEQLQRLVAHVRERLGPQVFVGIDQEGGSVARLSPRRGFASDPAAAELGLLAPEARVAVAERQATQLAALGFDLNFAPCVDLAIEPRSAIIAGLGRSYGRDPQRVIEMARVVLDAHARAGIATCLKHFPGHGSSRGDTHQGMVDITETWRRAEELAPYMALCSRPGVAVMVAHVVHRQLDPERPASLSPLVIEGLLRREIGFDGVVVTDSIDMRAIVDHFTPAGVAGGAVDGAAAGRVPPGRAGAAAARAPGRAGPWVARALGQAAVAAIAAGADLVVDAFNLDARSEHPAPVLVQALQAAVRDGRIAPQRIEASVQRLRRLRAEIGRTA